MDKINIGVIGTGSMGKNHLRLCAELPQFNLVGFFDPSPASEQYASIYEVPRFENMDDLLDKVDAVTVAAPSSLHKEIGLHVASKKKHALIEKPLALTYEDSQVLVKAFKEAGSILMVGQIERFNPVVSELAKILQTESQVVSINIQRCSPWNGRIGDADVIQDLMIHDVDLLINLLETSTVEKVFAVGRNVTSKANQIDYVQAIIEFSSGVMSSVVASRITEDKIREIIVHTKTSLIRANLLDRSLTITKRTNYTDSQHSASYKQENITERIFVSMVEPLKEEIIAFGDAISTGKLDSFVSGESASESLRVLELIMGNTYA